MNSYAEIRQRLWPTKPVTLLRFAPSVSLDYLPEWVLASCLDSPLASCLDSPRPKLAPGAPTILRIQQAVCIHLDVTMTDLLAHRRAAKLVRKRHIAMYLASALTGRSLPEIGRAFGNRDHTTILHAKRKVASLLEAGDEKLAADIAKIECLLAHRRAADVGRAGE
jgi:hypothetical protein